MIKIFFIFIILFFLFLATLSFASSRQEIIEETLTKIEARNKDILEKGYSKEGIYDRLAIKTSEFDATLSDPSDSEKKMKDIFYISAGHDANHMHYAERSGNGDKLDEDYGKLRGFYIAAGFKSNAYIKEIMGKPYIEGYFRRHDEIIHYRGAASNGVITWPFECDQKSKVERYGIKLGASGDFSKKGEIFGYMDIGRRIWYRGENEVISGVLCYAEKYMWPYFGLGGGINYKLVPKLSFGIDAEWLFTLNKTAKMRADLYEGGTFTLRNVYGAEVKMPIKYYLLKNLSFDATPYFTYWHIKESNLVLINGSYYTEPDSTTHIEGLFVGLTYNF